MRFHYDTEFVEDGHTIGLLSIGIVADDGREYYAVVDDTWTIQQAVEHPWLRENVVPSLPVKVYEHVGGMGTAHTRDGRFVEFGQRWDWDRAHPDYEHVKPRQQVANEVRNFLAPRPLNFKAADACELWADYGAYDHVALAQLWGPMIELPPGIPMWTNDLRQVIARLGLTDADLPQQEAGQHNALADARHNRTIAQFLDAYQDV